MTNATTDAKRSRRDDDRVMVRAKEEAAICATCELSDCFSGSIHCKLNKEKNIAKNAKTLERWLRNNPSENRRKPRRPLG